MSMLRAKFLGILVLAGAVILTGTGFAWADAERSQRFQRMRYMHGAEAPWISLSLKHRSDLNLTSDQVSALEQTRSQFQEQAAPVQTDLRNVEREIARLLQESPVDLAQVRMKIDEAEKFRSELRYLRVETLTKGKTVLTAEQTARLKELISSHHGRHRRSPKQGQSS